MAASGILLLIALLAVPVTTTSVRLRRDPDSSVIFRMTYPRNTTMFLPSLLSMKARSGENGGIRVRSAQWIGTMAIILALGMIDYFVFCGLHQRQRRRDGEPG
jgi:hypothetical protein